MRKVLEIFEKASNAKVNWAKSSGLPFRLKAPAQEVWPGRWLKEGETEAYLGVPFTLSLNTGLMWEKAIATVDKALQGGVGTSHR